MISLYSTLTGITTMSTNYEANLQRHAADTWNRSNKEHLTFTGRYYMQLNLTVILVQRCCLVSNTKGEGGKMREWVNKSWWEVKVIPLFICKVTEGVKILVRLSCFCIACIAAISFPFPNARKWEENCAQFFGSPQACSFACLLFVCLFDLRAAWKRKGIGCYAG